MSVPRKRDPRRVKLRPLWTYLVHGGGPESEEEWAALRKVCPELAGPKFAPSAGPCTEAWAAQALGLPE